MIALVLVGLSPAINPDALDFEAVFSGDYGVNGVGDPLNLAPYDADNNPGGWTNPKNLPTPSYPAQLEEAPAVLAQDIGGYQVQPDPLVPTAGATDGVANGLATVDGVALKVFAPGGAELATNVGYAGEVTGGHVLLRVTLPKDQ